MSEKLLRILSFECHKLVGIGFRQKPIGENKSGEILLQYYTTRLYTVHCHVTITHFHLTVTILTAANLAVLEEKLADFSPPVLYNRITAAL